MNYRSTALDIVQKCFDEGNSFFLNQILDWKPSLICELVRSRKVYNMLDYLTKTEVVFCKFERYLIESLIMKCKQHPYILSENYDKVEMLIIKMIKHKYTGCLNCFGNYFYMWSPSDVTEFLRIEVKLLKFLKDNCPQVLKDTGINAEDFICVFNKSVKKRN